MGELEIPYRRGEYRVESGAILLEEKGVSLPPPRGAEDLEKPDNRIPWASIKYLIGEVRAEGDVGGGGVTFRREGGVPSTPGERTRESRQEDPCQREGDVRPPPVPDLKSILDQIRLFRLFQTNI